VVNMNERICDEMLRVLTLRILISETRFSALRNRTEDSSVFRVSLKCMCIQLSCASEHPSASPQSQSHVLTFKKI
jgi:hypothetical protein